MEIQSLRGSDKFGTWILTAFIPMFHTLGHFAAVYLGLLRSILMGPMASALSGGGATKASPAKADDAKKARRDEKAWLSVPSSDT